jgi:hypothetical protein
MLSTKSTLITVAIGLSLAATLVIISNVASTKPDLLEFTSSKVEKAGDFKACDKSTPSLNIQITKSDAIKVNGINSKVTFSAKANLPASDLTCTGLKAEESREVRTPVYSFNISKSAGALVISNLKSLQTDESMPGVWVYR